MIARNRRANYDYDIKDTFEAGLSLVGSEVKSLRQGNATITEAHISISDFEAWVHNLHIPEYKYANRFNHEPKRKRKLLLHRHEIDRIKRRLEEKGYSAIPMELYFKGGFAKISFGLGKGRKHHDKRQHEKDKQDRRDMRDQGY